MNDLLVVGHGPAAHRLVDQLLRHGYPGRITVLGAEPQPAYNRMLLPSVLENGLAPEALLLPGHAFPVQVWQGVTVTGIDRRQRLVHTDSGGTHRYDTLVLATGARPRLPELPCLYTEEGQLRTGVTPLRTLADCAHLTRLAGNSGGVTVLGGGVLGVEVAAALNARGLDVALVHPEPRLMDRQLDSAGARMLAETLVRHGIDIRVSSQVAEYRPGTLTLDDGRVLAADALVTCTGVVPETGLAHRAGLAVGSGVVVDDQLRTTDEHVYAFGACAEHDGRTPVRAVRHGTRPTPWHEC